MTKDTIKYDHQKTTWDKSVFEFAKRYPDPYWKHHAESSSGMIERVGPQFTFELLPVKIQDKGSIMSMTFSDDYTLLATFSTLGHVRIWDTSTWQELRRFRDQNESEIEEFFVGTFTPNSQYVIVGGKRKDRHKWSEDDMDNHILPCPIKIFNVLTGECVARLHGHEEEILCMKRVLFKGQNYLITGSQDGYIGRWKMTSDWTAVQESVKFVDGITCMAFGISFIPDTGNKYFIAACDNKLVVFDLEAGRFVNRFDTPFSQYCDCVQVVNAVNLPYDESGKKPFVYVVCRGVEGIHPDGTAVQDSKCILYKLHYPITRGGPWKLQEERKFQFEGYQSHSWQVQLASNGRYLVAPTHYGTCCFFSLDSGQLVDALNVCEKEIRRVLFHPTKPLLLITGDDGHVYIYKQVAAKDKAANDTADDVHVD